MMWPATQSKAQAMLLSGDDGKICLKGMDIQWQVQDNCHSQPCTLTTEENEFLLPMEGNLHPGPHEPDGWPVQTGWNRHQNQHQSSEGNSAISTLNTHFPVGPHLEQPHCKPIKTYQQLKKNFLSNEKAAIYWRFSCECVHESGMDRRIM